MWQTTADPVIPAMENDQVARQSTERCDAE